MDSAWEGATADDAGAYRKVGSGRDPSRTENDHPEH
jgi:hypothetical protein